MVLVLALPGFLARRGYLSGVFTRKHLPRNLGDELILGLVLSLPSQVVWGWIYSDIADAFAWRSLGWEPVLHLLTGHYGPNDSGILDIVALFDVRLFAAQQVTLWVVAYSIGRLSRKFVRWAEWDHKWPSWRSASAWYYLLSGEVTKFPKSKITAPKTNSILTWVDVLTTCGGRLLLYSGVLESYHLNDRGGLESVYLLEPWAREFERIEDEGKPLAEGRAIVPHSVFVISGSAILNINVVYQTIPANSPTADILAKVADQQPTGSPTPTPAANHENSGPSTNAH